MLPDSLLKRIHAQGIILHAEGSIFGHGVNTHTILALLILREVPTRYLRHHKSEDEETYDDERIFSHGCKGTKKSEE
jgi:hypothetical protein